MLARHFRRRDALISLAIVHVLIPARDFSPADHTRIYRGRDGCVKDRVHAGCTALRSDESFFAKGENEKKIKFLDRPPLKI